MNDTNMRYMTKEWYLRWKDSFIYWCSFYTLLPLTKFFQLDAYQFWIREGEVDTALNHAVWSRRREKLEERKGVVRDQKFHEREVIERRIMWFHASDEQFELYLDCNNQGQEILIFIAMRKTRQWWTYNDSRINSGSVGRCITCGSGLKRIESLYRRIFDF